MRTSASSMSKTGEHSIQQTSKELNTMESTTPKTTTNTNTNTTCGDKTTEETKKNAAENTEVSSRKVPNLMEEADEALAQSLLMFLYADLRLLSATGRIYTKFETLSIDSDVALKITSADLAATATAQTTTCAYGTSEAPCNGISPSQIMAALMLEIKQEVEEHKKVEELRMAHSQKQTSKTNNKKQEETLLASEVEDGNEQSMFEEFIFTPSRHRKKKKGFVAGDDMHALLSCYNEMVKQDHNPNFRGVNARRHLGHFVRSLKEPSSKEIIESFDAAEEVLEDEYYDERFNIDNSVPSDEIESNESHITSDDKYQGALKVDEQELEDEYYNERFNIDNNVRINDIQTNDNDNGNTSDDILKENGKNPAVSLVSTIAEKIDDPSDEWKHDSVKVDNNNTNGEVENPKISEYIKDQLGVEAVESIDSSVLSDQSTATSRVTNRLRTSISDGKQKILARRQAVNARRSQFIESRRKQFAESTLRRTQFIEARKKQFADSATRRTQFIEARKKQFAERRKEFVDNVKYTLANEDDIVATELADVGNVFFDNMASNRVLKTDAVKRIMEQAVMSRVNGDLNFMAEFFRQGSVSRVMAESKARVVWLNDWYPIKDLVYAISVDSAKKRVLVLFRGAITQADWNHAWYGGMRKVPNPVLGDFEGKRKTVDIYHGFFRYLFRQRKDTGGSTKFDEICSKVHSYGTEQIGDDYEVVVVGYSLGAALGTLMAFYASTDERFTKNGPVKLFSFGSPMVGGQSFGDSFRHQEEQGHLQYARFFNTRDGVAHYPLNITPTKRGSMYVHVGVSIQLPRKMLLSRLHSPLPNIYYVPREGFTKSYCRAWRKNLLFSLPWPWRGKKIHSLNEHKKRLNRGKKACKNNEHLSNKSLDEIYKELVVVGRSGEQEKI